MGGIVALGREAGGGRPDNAAAASVLLAVALCREGRGENGCGVR
jgi:hypothetical protein